ncbi:hypothetical protein L596_029734 [Steinernema carpocapsae]|uniref:Uncharacterized protein n=1 Tax=Steinernema carpocapsae TaxID=34508 RepID=A0A4U5LQM2_STECR|nr:hypothetical protein L596_029734 [Steinernema carpocapsae]
MDRQALCKKTKIHGNIESKQDAERNDDGTPKKLPNSNFADDSYSRNEKMLRFFAAFGVPFQAVIFFGFRIRFRIGSNAPDRDPDRIGSKLDPIRHLWSTVLLLGRTKCCGARLLDRRASVSFSLATTFPFSFQNLICYDCNVAGTPLNDVLYGKSDANSLKSA